MVCDICDDLGVCLEPNHRFYQTVYIIYIYIPAQHSNLAHCTAARANLPQYFVLPLRTACHGPEEHI